MNNRSTNIIKNINIKDFLYLTYSKHKPNYEHTLSLFSSYYINGQSLDSFLKNDVNEVKKTITFLVDNNLIDFNEKSVGYDDFLSFSFYIMMLYFDKNKVTSSEDKLNILKIYLKSKVVDEKVTKNDNLIDLPFIVVKNIITSIYKELNYSFNKNDKKYFFPKNFYNAVIAETNNFKNNLNHEDFKNIILSSYLIKNNKINEIDKNTMDKLFNFFDLQNIKCKNISRYEEESIPKLNTFLLNNRHYLNKGPKI